MKSNLLTGLVAGVALLVGPVIANAATLGTDTASNYGGGWTNGTNQGVGFGAWNIFTDGSGGYGGNYLGDNSFNTGNTVSGGTEFGLYGATGTTSHALRSLDAPLQVGQTFTIRVGVNYRNGYKGVDVNGTDNAQLFNFNVGGDNYVATTPGAGSTTLTDPYSSNAVFQISLTQTTATGGTWEIDGQGGTSGVNTGTFTGVVANFQVYVGGTDLNGGSPNDINFNGLAVTPEPASASLLLAGGLFGLSRRRRRTAK